MKFFKLRGDCPTVYNLKSGKKLNTFSTRKQRKQRKNEGCKERHDAYRMLSIDATPLTIIDTMVISPPSRPQNFRQCPLEEVQKMIMGIHSASWTCKKSSNRLYFQGGL